MLVTAARVARSRSAINRSFIVSAVGFASVGHDLSVGEYDGTVGVGGGHRIVRDHDDGLAKLVDRTLPGSRGAFGAGNRVEVASRLVSEHQLRLYNQRAGDGPALLLRHRTVHSVGGSGACFQSQGIDEQVEPGVVRLVSGESIGMRMFCSAVNMGNRLKLWKMKCRSCGDVAR